jgi:hypothetical protein
MLYWQINIKSLKEVEHGNQEIRSARVVEAVQEWGCKEWIGTMAKPNYYTALPDVIAMLWDTMLNCMRSFGFKWTDGQEPTALRQQLKGLAEMVCH